MDDDFIVLPINMEPEVTIDSTEMSSHLGLQADYHEKAELASALTTISEMDLRSRPDLPSIDCLCSHCYSHLSFELDNRLRDRENVLERYSAKYREMEEEMEILDILGTVSKRGSAVGFIEQQLASVEMARSIEEVNNSCKGEIQSLDRESRELEDLYFQKRNAIQAKLDSLSEERDTCTSEIKRHLTSMKSLRKRNLLNDMFYISIVNSFGTINNCRLGKVHANPVDWEEINAALGQLVLLLQVMASRINFNFTTYSLKYMGNYSEVGVAKDGSSIISNPSKGSVSGGASSAGAAEDRATDSIPTGNGFTYYKLYGSDPHHSSTIIPSSTTAELNTALVSLCGAITDFINMGVKSIDATFDKLPFRMKKDTVGDVSIRLEPYQNDRWTLALKHLLVNLRYLIAWSDAHA